MDAILTRVTLQELVLRLNLPEPEYGVTLPAGLCLPLAYVDDRAGLVAGVPPTETDGWRLIPCDPADPASLKGALLTLAAALGYLETGAAEAQPALTPAPDPAGPALTPTAQQRAAIQHGSGPARVLAGAGTGKTTVVVGRFHHLLARGVAPEKILVLTFSREASRSLRDAILPGIRAAGRLWISTFHSFCLRLLEEEGVGGLRLVTEPESRTILRGLASARPWRWYAGTRAQRLPEEAFTFIGQAKDDLLRPADVAAYAAQAQDERLADLADIYDAFQAELARLQAAEFSDFIYKAVSLLEGDPALAVRWQQRFDQILVDEFQDTNLAQFRVLQVLSAQHRNLMVVGDDDQAIYRFRGATDRFMVHFDQYLPGAVTYPVAENFRCPRPVLDLANALIAGNAAYRVPKQLITATKLDGFPPVRHQEARSEREEAEAVAAEIADRIRSGERKPGDFAILCRSVRRSAGEFVRGLAGRGVPCRLVGSEEVHPVIAQTLALLRLTRGLNYDDLLRVLAGRVPAPDLYAAVRASGGDPARLLDGEGGPAIVKQAVADLRRWLTAQQGQSLPQQVYGALLWLGHLKLTLTPTLDDLDRLAAARSLQERAAAAPDLGGLLAGGEAAGPSAPGEGVTIMTVHAAKGLQFPVVYVVGLAEGRFPAAVEHTPVFCLASAIRDWLDHPGGATAPADAERLRLHLLEERRLLYVALTRAEAELILTRARQYGQDQAQPSRFLAEMQAPGPEPVGHSLADPVAEARAYLVAVTEGAELDDPARLAAAVKTLAGAPSAVPLRRQAPPAPFKPGESLTLSATSLEQYRDCPRKYYYSQVLRLPDEDNVYLAFGDAVHNALERYHRAVQAGGSPAWEEVEAWWTETLAAARCESAGQYLQLLNRGRLFLKRYHAWAADRWQQIIAVEERFAGAYTDKAGRTHRVVGRYDLIAIGPDGLEIIDFKTGHRRGATTVNKKRSNSDNDPERKLQLGLYYLARFGGQIDPARVTYIFLRHLDDKYPDRLVDQFNLKNEQVISCTHTAETLQAIRARVDEIIEGILANRFERAPEESKCNRCPFQQPCEVTPHDWF